MAKKKYKVTEESKPKKKRTVKKAIKESKEEMMPEQEEMKEEGEEEESEGQISGEDRLKRLAVILKKLSGKKIKVKQ